jgi:hypothetical protein
MSHDTREALQSVRDRMETLEIMEFGHPVRVHPDGSVTDAASVYAPDLYDEAVGSGWTLLDGYSNQYGYAGPIMHPSEFIGGRMARDILAEPGVYVALVSYSTDDDDVNGWAVARLCRVERAS